jgi:hypothetical protein
MTTVIFDLGDKIYNAALAGAALGYNRTTNEYQHYEKAINAVYQTNINGIPKEARYRIQKITGNNWIKAYLPLCLAMFHYSKKGIPCEAHTRVYLSFNPGAVFDIPMKDWEKMRDKQ